MDRVAAAAARAEPSALAPQPIERAALLQRLRSTRRWDAVVVGGGATGLGIAVDAAQRGLAVALIEAGDFGSGTSSRSTKLIHGGVRYLAQGNLKLVREALAERATLLRLAPHIVHRLEFVVPCYAWTDIALLRTGLGLYDALAGSRGVGPTRWLSPAQTVERLPGVRADGLRGGVSYWDAQFDDALMCIALMQTAFALGAAPINYVRCESLRPQGDGWRVGVADGETGERIELDARCVFNAAGVWGDAVRRLAQPAARPLLRLSQGSHLVVGPEFLGGSAGLMVPKTRDGRVLFALPWRGRVIIGTTDEPRAGPAADPRPTEAEIAFMLETARGYLRRPPGRADVRASFAGLRPLYSPAAMPRTSSISREHAVIDEGGLITVVGGKWTTYRRMAADALAVAARARRLPAGLSATAGLAVLRDPVLVAGAAVAPDTAFIDHCRRCTQARRDDDLWLRRSRAGLLG